jgi:hypothetical protein
MTTPKQTPANTRGNDHLASHLGAGSGGLEPASAQGSLAVVGVLACLAASAAALAVAPILMPTSYSWVAHTTSESAAQGVPGAWLARLGFVTFGFAVLAVAGLARHLWGRLAAWLHAGFGVLMVTAAVFSARSWEPGVPFDAVEDVLHSVSATAMGFAFAFGVVAVAWRIWRAGGGLRWLDITAVTASVVLPLAMVGWEQFAGALQRPIFVVAYVWYAVEAVHARHAPSPP